MTSMLLKHPHENVRLTGSFRLHLVCLFSSSELRELPLRLLPQHYRSIVFRFVVLALYFFPYSRYNTHPAFIHVRAYSHTF